MTARKNQADKDNEKDEAAKAGSDQSKDTQTSTEAADQEVPDAVQEQGDTDVEGAASGAVAGGVVPGDIGDEGVLVEQYDDGVEGALGTVQERGRSGDGYDVPWKYVDSEDFEDVPAVRTSDSDDPARSWTVQDTEGDGDEDDVAVALVPVQGVPGQTFTPEELPNIEVMKEAGIDPVQFLSGLPVRQSLGDDEGHRRGIPA